MPRLSRVHSFLDRFEQHLEVECERLKRQLLAQVDQQFGALRQKVAELRNRFCGTRPGTVNIDPWIDYPPVETVPLDLCTREKQEQHADLVKPSTSTGRKRQSSSTSRTVNNKRHKTVTSNGSNKYQCKSPGCGKLFRDDYNLVNHERIHLNIKPYSCTWPDCKCASEQRPVLVRHIRSVHFKLPRSVKKQNELNIIDDRDPNEFVRVDQQLANRRL